MSEYVPPSLELTTQAARGEISGWPRYFTRFDGRKDDQLAIEVAHNALCDAVAQAVTARETDREARQRFASIQARATAARDSLRGVDEFTLGAADKRREAREAEAAYEAAKKYHVEHYSEGLPAYVREAYDELVAEHEKYTAALRERGERAAKAENERREQERAEAQARRELRAEQERKVEAESAAARAARAAERQKEQSWIARRVAQLLGAPTESSSLRGTK